MIMKTQITLIILLLSLVALLWWNNRPVTPASRQIHELAMVDYAYECEYVREALRFFKSDFRKFPTYWASSGDNYQQAVRLLKELDYHSPEVVQVYRNGTNDRQITIEVQETGKAPLCVTLWREEKRVVITDISKK